MSNKSLLDYLVDKTGELEFDGSLEWNWLKKDWAFILEINLYVENQSTREILDLDGTKADQPVIEFFDQILLYNQKKPLNFEENDFLTCLGFDGKSGWTKGKADAFLDVLQDTLDNGESDLLDFVNDPDIEEFELTWDEEEFNKQISKNKTDTVKLPYPKF